MTRHVRIETVLSTDGTDYRSLPTGDGRVTGSTKQDEYGRTVVASREEVAHAIARMTGQSVGTVLETIERGEN